MAPEYLIKKSPLRKINNYIDDNYDFFNFFNLEKGIENFDSQNNSFNLKEYDEFWYREKNQFKLCDEIVNYELDNKNITIYEKTINENDIKQIDESTSIENLNEKKSDKNENIKKRKKKNNKKKKKKKEKIIFKCYCGKQYNSKENYNLHYKNVHLKIKPYKCNFCEISFSHRNGKNYHERKYHTFIFPYVCKNKNCKKLFASNSALNYHMKTKHSKNKNK